MRHLNKLVARSWIRTHDHRMKSHLLSITLIHSWWPIHGKFQQRYLEYKLGLVKNMLWPQWKIYHKVVSAVLMRVYN